MLLSTISHSMFARCHKMRWKFEFLFEVHRLRINCVRKKNIDQIQNVSQSPQQFSHLEWKQKSAIFFDFWRKKIKNDKASKALILTWKSFWYFSWGNASESLPLSKLQNQNSKRPPIELMVFFSDVFPKALAQLRK